MGVVGVVSRAGRYFREYQIERNDWLIRVCLRYGHRDWRAVYEHPLNAPFRARFPDPNQIDFVNAVNLFIPLIGDSQPVRDRRARPIEDFFVVRIYDDFGSPFADVPLRLIEPGGTDEGRTVFTDENGELILSNPPHGPYEITALDHELVPVEMASADYPARELTSFPMPGGSRDPSTRFPLTVNTIREFAARPVFFLACPMCGINFKTVRKAPDGGDVLCPNDGANLSEIHVEIETDSASFLALSFTQNPQATPTDLHCRGVFPFTTAHGPTYIFWDESRFAIANGGDYTLWGRTAAGADKTVHIVGRATWGAAALMFGGDRRYEFHDATVGASPPYTFAVPKNDETPLREVLFWITVHHSAEPARSSHTTARQIQGMHQRGEGENGPKADVGYHFIIDANGDVYEGRALGVEGSHVGFFNAGNVGVLVAGDFEPRAANLGRADTPTPAALRSLEDLVDVLAARFTIKDVGPHSLRNREVGPPAPVTVCPGANLEPFVTSTLRGRYPGPP